jgi:hypothetical protein
MMFTNVPHWTCPLCGLAMFHGYRQSHKCKCKACGEEVGGSQSETHECNDAAKEILKRRAIESEAEKARVEMENTDNVATLLHEWETDATKGLSAEQQDAHVTIEAKRGFAEFLRGHGL